MEHEARLKKIPNEIDKEIGRRIKARRIELGLNQQQLGDAIDVSYQQVQKYENGSDRVGASRLFAVSKFLRVDVSYFFDTKDIREGRTPPPSIGDQFATTEQGRQLIMAFAGIADDQVRQKLIEMMMLLSRSLSAPHKTKRVQPLR